MGDYRFHYSMEKPKQVNAIRNATDARYAALAIRRRLEDVARMVAANPNLVRLVTGDGGDQMAFWYDNGREVTYNVSAAERKIAEIQRVFPEAMKSRSGQILELPILR